MDHTFHLLLLSVLNPNHLKTYLITAISRKVARKNGHATIPQGNMGYVKSTVLDTVAVEPTFVAFL